MVAACSLEQTLRGRTLTVSAHRVGYTVQRAINAKVCRRNLGCTSGDSGLLEPVERRCGGPGDRSPARAVRRPQLDRGPDLRGRSVRVLGAGPSSSVTQSARIAARRRAQPARVDRRLRQQHVVGPAFSGGRASRFRAGARCAPTRPGSRLRFCAMVYYADGTTGPASAPVVAAPR